MKFIIIYDSKTGNTEKMAMSIEEGIKEGADEVIVKKVGDPFPLTVLTSNDAVIFGSPTRYADITNEMRDFLSHIEGYAKLGKINLKGKNAAIFGSYGYDGAWVMEDRFRSYLEAIGYRVYPKVCVKVDTEFKFKKRETLSDCRAWGKEYAKSLK